MARNTSDSLIWFIAGAALGASVALLYAPQRGRDTRRLIVRKTRQGREAVADAGRDLKDRGRDLAVKGRDLFDKGRRVADDAAELFERGRKLVEG